MRVRLSVFLAALLAGCACPVPPKPCPLAPACVLDAPGQPPAPKGAPCNGGGTCDGAGKCCPKD